MKKGIYLFLCIFIIGIVEGNSGFEKNTKKKKAAGEHYGIASFYHNKFNGRRTASGEIFRQTKLTAAVNHLPLGTRLRVTNLNNNRSVIVKVNDRMHRKNTRLIDLTRAAATLLNVSSNGILRVKVAILGREAPPVKTK